MVALESGSQVSINYLSKPTKEDRLKIVENAKKKVSDAVEEFTQALKLLSEPEEAVPPAI